MDEGFARSAREIIVEGVGRRDFVKAVAAVGAGVGVAGLAGGCARSGSAASALSDVKVLQPGQGTVEGNHYLQSTPDQVLWGYVPNVHATAVVRMKSAETITVDAVSHEGILEDQGRNPVA
jgi:hypothetical protein